MDTNGKTAGANRPRGKGRPRTSETAAGSLVDILNLVRTGRASTRQELERESEFGRAVVADRLATLGELGLVDESETGVATGGRAPRLVRFVKDRGRLIVATLDQSSIGVGLADLSGALLTEHHEAGDLAAPAAQTVDRLVTLINWIMSRQPADPGLWGISISVPGPVLADDRAPFLDSTPEFLPGWNASQLVEKLVRSFGVPVWISSSVDTMTMGELHGGEGQGRRTMLFVKIGKRIGAGLVSGGRPYRGANGAVGLIGQLPVRHDGRSGTLDSLAGSEMLRQEGLAAAESGSSPYLGEILRRGGEVTANDVCQGAQMGDVACTEIVMQSGRLIGGVVATLASMLNPELIVLAGSVAQTNDILLAAVREAVYGASHPLVTRDMRILRSQMSSSAGLLGAAWIGVEALFAPESLREWIMAGTPTGHPALVALRSALERNQSEEERAKAGGAHPPPAA